MTSRRLRFGGGLCYRSHSSLESLGLLEAPVEGLAKYEETSDDACVGLNFTSPWTSE